MAYDWNSMKKSLQTGIDSKGGNKDFNDPREWKLQRDENDNGTAVIRLLPGKDGGIPIVRVFEHSVRIFNKAQNKYRYYIEPSPSSIDEPCPVSEIWYELGDVGTEQSKKMQKTFSRKVSFISNILVVNDPANPENNGKVFFWKYGVKLFEKFKQALEPTDAQLKVGKKPIELFDPMLGANITLEIARSGEFLNYDGTTIDAPSQAFDSEEQMIDVIENKCIDLNEFISKEHYKPYNELKSKIAWVLEKSPEEALLVSIGSNVISEPYVDKKRTGVSAGGTGKASTEPEKETLPEPKAKSSYEEAKERAAAKKQEAEKAPEVEKAPEKKDTSSQDDDILAMLGEL